MSYDEHSCLISKGCDRHLEDAHVPERGTASPLRTRNSSFGIRHSRSVRGFTLLEMTLALFIFSLLMVAVFTIVRAVTQLSTDLTNEQQRDARIHGFVEMATRLFRSLPPEAMVRLRTKQAGRGYLSQLVLAGSPSPVTGAGGGVTVLETEEAPDGYLRLVLRSLTQEQAIAWDKGDSSAGVRVALLDNIASLEWKFFNPLSGEWEPVLNEKLNLANVLQAGDMMGADSTPPPTPGADGNPQPPADPANPNPITGTGGADGLNAGLASAAGRRPTMVELKFAFGVEEPQKWTLWTPPGAMR